MKKFRKIFEKIYEKIVKETIPEEHQKAIFSKSSGALRAPVFEKNEKMSMTKKNTGLESFQENIKFLINCLILCINFPLIFPVDPNRQHVQKLHKKSPLF